MKKLIFLLPIIGLFVGCDPVTQPDNEVAREIKLNAAQQARVSQDNEFAFDLLRKTMADSEESNVFLSPLSVSIALGMALNGAEGDTEEQISAALKLSNLTTDEINKYYRIMQSELPGLDSKTKLSISNAVWYNEGFSVKSDFLKLNADHFNAYIKMLNFKESYALDTINNWCSRSTNGLIPTILNSISPDAVMYLMNAVYFKGMWATKFDKSKTFETGFTNDKNEIVKVNMMTLKDTFNYAEDQHAQYLQMPYGNKAYSMTVILPLNKQTPADVLAQLSTDKWNDIQRNLSVNEVDVYMPRLKIENTFSLKNVLSEMGMPVAFTEFADFSGVSDQQILISDVKHKTYITVDEDGTEAAAVTSVEFTTTSMPTNPVFYVNKPFAFVISEKSTGVILFAGKIGNPGKY